MNKKNLGAIILIIVLLVLVGYLYSGAAKCKTAATELGAKLQECGTGLETCIAQATQCQAALSACTSVLPTE